MRQLRNVMEWLIIMAKTDSNGAITADALPPELIDSNITMPSGTFSNDIMSMPLCVKHARPSEAASCCTDQPFRWKHQQTSNFVGMERSALHRKLKMLGIGNEDKNAA